MKILAIETSCDDTAVSVVEMSEEEAGATPLFKVLSQVISSQTAIHRLWGGVVPNLAKREHNKNIVLVLLKSLTEAGLLEKESSTQSTASEKNDQENPATENKLAKIKEILVRNEGLFETFSTHIPRTSPDIDAIAVTKGPGLEPALWVGINIARALALLWDKPLVPINHIEGHLVSPMASESDIKFPALGLVVSGGHTELILIKSWGQYEKIGQTRDDALGEAFDKVARLMDLPYPGGPEISKLAKIARDHNLPSDWQLPRPMLNSPDLDFSFSGLKTAVRYAVEQRKPLTEESKQTLAREFEEAVVEVLIKKTSDGLNTHQAQSLVVGGGVSANRYLRESLETLVRDKFPTVKLLIPQADLSTDNATMIGIACGLKYLNSPVQTNNENEPAEIVANGNLSI